MRVLALVAIVTGCWSSPQPAPQEPAPATLPSSAPSALEQHRSTVWKGRYVCAQGATALQLTIESSKDALEAIFEFGPLAENPNVPRGSYKMHGVATRLGDGEYTVMLEPSEWIEHPDHYMMVGLQATTSHEHQLLQGKITNATCADVELSRVR